MLRHLRVTNFAILSDVAIELGDGMNVLTGETGAGKSLIVEAVNLLRGGRASADIPRAGADEAVVEAVVEVPDDLAAHVARVIEGAGLPAGDHREVFIRRVIQRGGRSRTYVNGALTTLARLAELGALLIDLSGQHQHQGLVDPGRHLEILDAFAGEPALGAAMAAAWAELKRCDDELASLGGDERQREARLDYLRYQLDELDGAALLAGEDTALDLERARLASVDQLAAAARAAEDSLYGGDDSARDRVAAAAREVERAARTDPGLEPMTRQLGEIETLIDDAADQLRDYADKLEGDPERLAWLDERLALIRRLTRKHNGSLDEVIAKAHELRLELDALTGRDVRLAELSSLRGRAEAGAVAAAAALTKSRRHAARRLEKEVGATLVELGMGAARLSVVIEPRGLGAGGTDRIELMLASNKGEDTRPLTKVASGGELSRIMLALKLALRRADEVATYVFDEVDTGIGGAAAQVVGSQIRAVADHRQVLCVTHLPQIAAYADHHFHVEKTELAGRTETHVRRLTATARRDELARMLGGHATSKARAHAAELLAEAARPRRSHLARVS
ncbi:MAG TPA: DNA repair protein RecN [Kofleriaceae bacterium]|jgi:DNA repair protein RecN (Recombination protein N)|nr:DNA repair protein RecN [Kofleriaceae bacterium]